MSTACQTCNAGGLPVLPSRYAVVPANFPVSGPDGLGLYSGERVKDVAIDPARYKYALRTLRPGFVYLFYEKGPQGNNYWEAYTVTADGGLWKRDDAASAQPAATMQCSNAGHSALRMQYLVIEKPEQCGKVWLAYSEHKWNEKTIKRYEGSAARATRMQCIEPAVWITSAQAVKHQGILATESNLKTIIEYNGDLQVSELASEVIALPHGGLDRVRVVSQLDGQYDAAILAQQFTRHEWYLRNKASQGEKDRPLAQLIQQMSDKCGDPSMGLEYWPMGIALWDAIGIADELNGFSNDALGMIAKYGDERTLQITAMTNIEAAKAALESNASQRAQSYAQDMDARVNAGYSPVEIGMRNRVISSVVPSMEGRQAFAALDMRRSTGEISDAEYQRQRSALLDQHVAPERRGAADRAFASYDADREKLKQTRNDNLENYRQRQVREAWERYDDNVDWNKLNAFKRNYNAFQARAAALADERIGDLIKWLEAPLFLDTLQDYHPEDPDDGAEFAEVVADLTEGIGASVQGERYMKMLVEERTDANARGALFWRAVAGNQTGVGAELTQALSQAKAAKDTLLPTALTLTTQILNNLKLFSSYYKRAVGLANEKKLEKLTALPRALKNANIDKLMMTCGDKVFAWLRLRNVGDFVGEKIIQSIFLARAGVDPVDNLRLIRLQAQYEGASRSEALARVRTARTFLEANEAISRERGNVALRDMWGKIRPADGRAGATGMRIGVVVGLIELVNFSKMVSAADKTSKNYFQLVASASTLSAAIIDIAIVPYTLMGKTSLGFQKWKLRGAALGGIASIVGAGIDASAFAQNFRERRYAVGALYLVKTVLGVAAFGATAITAIATSAPLLKRVAGRAGVEIVVLAVERVSAQVAAATVARVLGFLVGWEIALILVAIQLLVWYFTPSALEEWCETGAFGRQRFGTPVTDPKKQEETFVAALADVM